MDKKLSVLLDEIKVALEEKEKADHAIINAEFKRKKAQYNYLNLMQTMRAREYVI